MENSVFVRVVGNEFANYIDGVTQAPIDWFGPLAHVNVLLGATNSGKSRLMRELARPAMRTQASGDLVQAARVIYRTCERWSGSPILLRLRFSFVNAIRDGLQIPAEYQEKLRGLDYSAEYQLDGFFFDQISTDLSAILAQNKNAKERYGPLQTRAAWLWLASSYFNDEKSYLRTRIMLRVKPGESSDLPSGFADDLATVEPYLRTLSNLSAPTLDDRSRVYVPVLRSAVRLFHSDSPFGPGEDVLGDTIRANYGFADSDVEVFTGGDSTKRSEPLAMVFLNREKT
jgi:hypothetical protein